MGPMSSAPKPDEIARDATWLAQALDPSAGLVRLVAMDRETYRLASFLDDRLLQQAVDAQILPWQDVESAMAGEHRTDARWIFHIGHVGSTLISRLIGELDGVLAVREPRLLRDLAVSPPAVRQQYMRQVPRLMSRAFEEDEYSCVKATSFASEIVSDLVPPGERALFMYAGPRNYVASILAGENSLKELRQLEMYRNERLASRQINLPGFRTDADRAAAAWACEMTTLESAAAAMPDRMLAWADFDVMLLDMEDELARVAEFFRFGVDPGRLASILAGPLMKRYSKDQSYEYSPMLRGQLIEQELEIQGREIQAALAMLHAAAEESPLLARAMERGGLNVPNS